MSSTKSPPPGSSPHISKKRKGVSPPDMMTGNGGYPTYPQQPPPTYDRHQPPSSHHPTHDPYGYASQTHQQHYPQGGNSHHNWQNPGPRGHSGPPPSHPNSYSANPNWSQPPPQQQMYGMHPSGNSSSPDRWSQQHAPPHSQPDQHYNAQNQNNANRPGDPSPSRTVASSHSSTSGNNSIPNNSRQVGGPGPGWQNQGPPPPQNWQDQPPISHSQPPPPYGHPNSHNMWNASSSSPQNTMEWNGGPGLNNNGSSQMVGGGRMANYPGENGNGPELALCLPANPDNEDSTARNELDKDKGRGSYRCGKCGVPKKGHVCPYQPKLKRRPDEPPPETRNASTQVEMDEFLVVRRLNLEIQGFPESYISEPTDNVGTEVHNPNTIPPPPQSHHPYSGHGAGPSPKGHPPLGPTPMNSHGGPPLHHGMMGGGPPPMDHGVPMSQKVTSSSNTNGHMSQGPPMPTSYPMEQMNSGNVGGGDGRMGMGHASQMQQPTMTPPMSGPPSRQGSTGDRGSIARTEPVISASHGVSPYRGGSAEAANV